MTKTKETGRGQGRESGEWLRTGPLGNWVGEAKKGLGKRLPAWDGGSQGLWAVEGDEMDGGDKAGGTRGRGRGRNSAALGL